MDIDRELEEVNFIECEITLLEERVKCLLRQILDLEHELKVPWRNCSGVLDFTEEGYIVVGGMPLMPLPSDNGNRMQMGWDEICAGYSALAMQLALLERSSRHTSPERSETPKPRRFALHALRRYVVCVQLAPYFVSVRLDGRLSLTSYLKALRIFRGAVGEIEEGLNTGNDHIHEEAQADASRDGCDSEQDYDHCQQHGEACGQPRAVSGSSESGEDMERNIRELFAEVVRTVKRIME